MKFTRILLNDSKSKTVYEAPRGYLIHGGIGLSENSTECFIAESTIRFVYDVKYDSDLDLYFGKVPNDEESAEFRNPSIIKTCVEVCPLYSGIFMNQKDILKRLIAIVGNFAIDSYGNTYIFDSNKFQDKMLFMCLNDVTFTNNYSIICSDDFNKYKLCDEYINKILCSSQEWNEKQKYSSMIDELVKNGNFKYPGLKSYLHGITDMSHIKKISDILSDKFAVVGNKLFILNDQVLIGDIFERLKCFIHTEEIIKAVMFAEIHNMPSKYFILMKSGALHCLSLEIIHAVYSRYYSTATQYNFSNLCIRDNVMSFTRWKDKIIFSTPDGIFKYTPNDNMCNNISRCLAMDLICTHDNHIIIVDTIGNFNEYDIINAHLEFIKQLPIRMIPKHWKCSLNLISSADRYFNDVIFHF